MCECTAVVGCCTSCVRRWGTSVFLLGCVAMMASWNALLSSHVLALGRVTATKQIAGQRLRPHPHSCAPPLRERLQLLTGLHAHCALNVLRAGPLGSCLADGRALSSAYNAGDASRDGAARRIVHCRAFKAGQSQRGLREGGAAPASACPLACILSARPQLTRTHTAQATCTAPSPRTWRTPPSGPHAGDVATMHGSVRRGSPGRRAVTPASVHFASTFNTKGRRSGREKSCAPRSCLCPAPARWRGDTGEKATSPSPLSPLTGPCSRTLPCRCLAARRENAVDQRVHLLPCAATAPTPGRVACVCAGGPAAQTRELPVARRCCPPVHALHLHAHRVRAPPRRKEYKQQRRAERCVQARELRHASSGVVAHFPSSSICTVSSTKTS